jgi:hypothetical protein
VPGVLHRWRVWLPWLPAAIAAVFVVGFLVELRDVVLTLYGNSDNASAPVIAELLHEAPDGRQVLLGNYPWYEPLWFMLATRGLPAHRAIWELAPFAFSAVAILAVARSVAVAVGRWAAATALAVLAVPSVLYVGFAGVADAHGHTLVHACLLGAATVLAARRSEAWSTKRAVMAGVALGAVTAPGAASDQVLIFAGLVPLAVAAAAVWTARGGRTIVLFAAAAEVVAIAGGIALHAAGTAAGIRPASTDFALVSDSALWIHLRLLWEVLVAFGHGDFFGQATDVDGVLALAGAALVSGSLVALYRRARTIRLSDATQADPARVALVAFWTAAFAGVSLAFVLVAVATDKFGGRYILTAWVALVVLGVAAVRTETQRLMAAAVASGLALLGVLALSRGNYTATPGPVSQDAANRIARFVREQHLDHGYAGYWVAATLTWESKAVARTYPVYECVPPAHTLCPFKLHRIDSWYRPRGGVRTFLVLDALNTDPAIAPPDPALFGRPIAAEKVGTLTVLAYPYDVAEKITGPGAPATS